MQLRSSIALGKYECTQTALKSSQTLVISEDACLMLKQATWEVQGEILVYGVLDLREGSVIIGDGNVSVKKRGIFYKTPYDVSREGTVAFVGTPIYLGQALGKSKIPEEKIFWSTGIAGNWRFAEPKLYPDLGCGLFDAVFVPKNTLSYDEKRFEGAGQVTVIPTPTPVPTPTPTPIPTVGADTSNEPRNTEKNENFPQAQTSGGTTGSEKEGQKTVVVTKMVSTPSTIQKKLAKSFADRKVTVRMVSKKKQCHLVWNPVLGAMGYQLQYKKGKKSWQTKDVQKKCRYTIRKNTTKKNCRIRVRAYKVTKDKKGRKKRTYTKWSSIKKG